ncbi:hypothetical protein ACFQ7B_40420 [Streptomyces erythrochromogenes]|uniref:hypothetical protein n=1 Tax=Streptomyces erythrochromogenes TaxID=285574 RepID=UPI0036950AB9
MTMRDANVPQYVKDEGGVAPTIDENLDSPTTHGAMAAQWNKEVRADFQAMLKAMAGKFDGKLAGVPAPLRDTTTSASASTSGSNDSMIDYSSSDTIHGRG